MNIFVLSTSPRLCARYHCDKHVVKMIVESTQLLCTAHHVQGTGRSWMYKQTHVNHPCSIWVRSNKANYIYVLELAEHLCQEFLIRYGHEHKTKKLIVKLRRLSTGRHPGKPAGFVFCGPDGISTGSVVARYRKLYLLKSKTMKVEWRHSTKPVWFRRK